MTAELIISPHGVPERLFCLGELTVDGTRVEGSMRPAGWMRHDDGRPAAGALGVVLDVVVGQPTLSTRPEGTWPVTTELSIDVLAPPDPDGGPVAVAGELVAADGVAALSAGDARGPDGTVLATATARTRYTPGVPDVAAATTRPVTGPASTAAQQGSLRAAFGAGIDGDRMRVPPGSALLNAADHVHGGIVVCLADVLATAVVAGGPTPLVTAGIRFAYLRPGVAGELELTARVRHRGRTTALVDVDAIGADGKLCASGRITAHRPA